MSYAYRDSTGITGRPILASLCAGPIFMLLLILWTAVIASPQWQGGPSALFITPLAVPFGFVVALVPNLLGTAAMHAMGKANDAARLPVFWALAGAILAGGILLAFDAPPKLAGLFAATGAASALVCRIGARWP